MKIVLFTQPSLLNFRLKWPNDIYTENGIKIGGKELFCYYERYYLKTYRK